MIQSRCSLSLSLIDTVGVLDCLPSLLVHSTCLSALVLRYQNEVTHRRGRVAHGNFHPSGVSLIETMYIMPAPPHSSHTSHTPLLETGEFSEPSIYGHASILIFPSPLATRQDPPAIPALQQSVRRLVVEQNSLESSPILGGWFSFSASRGIPAIGFASRYNSQKSLYVCAHAASR